MELMWETNIKTETRYDVLMIISKINNLFSNGVNIYIMQNFFSTNFPKTGRFKQTIPDIITLAW